MMSDGQHEKLWMNSVIWPADLIRYLQVMLIENGSIWFAALLSFLFCSSFFFTFPTGFRRHVNQTTNAPRRTQATATSPPPKWWMLKNANDLVVCSVYLNFVVFILFSPYSCAPQMPYNQKNFQRLKAKKKPPTTARRETKHIAHAERTAYRKQIERQRASSNSKMSDNFMRTRRLICM